MPRWTTEEYAAYQARHRSAGAVAQPTPGDAPVSAPQTQAQDTNKFVVSIVSHRRRLLDVDNLVAKYHVDALRYAGLLPSDAPDQTDIKISQVKVPTKNDEFTYITIERI